MDLSDDRRLLASPGSRAELIEGVKVVVLQHLFECPKLGAHWRDVDVAVHKAYPWMTYTTSAGWDHEVAVFTTQALAALANEGRLRWQDMDGGSSAWSYLTVKQWLRMSSQLTLCG